VFNKEEERRALTLVSSYLLDAKEIKEKTVPPIIVLVKSGLILYA
jgi:hypothetical protein